MLPFAEGRGGRSKEGKRQRDGDREGERGPRLFQLWTVLSRASLMDLKQPQDKAQQLLHVQEFGQKRST